MSVFTNVRNYLESELSTALEDVEGTKAWQILENGYEAAKAELESIAPAQLEKAVEIVGVAALGALSDGTDAAIAAGIAAAPAAFEAAEHTITSATTHTLVSSVVTQLQSQPPVTTVAS